MVLGGGEPRKQGFQRAETNQKFFFPKKKNSFKFSKQQKELNRP